MCGCGAHENIERPETFSVFDAYLRFPSKIEFDDDDK